MKVKYRLLVALACALYFTSYVTRLDFNAALASIVENTPLTKSQAGLIGTALFFSYGFGQIVSGFLGDKVKPQLLIFIGLIVTVVCNTLFPLFTNVAVLVAVWGVNGFAQAMFWPPLVKILIDFLPAEKFPNACFCVSVAAQAATILIYLLVPLILVTLNWQAVFYIASGFALLIVVVWAFGFRAVTCGMKKTSGEGDLRSDPAIAVQEKELSEKTDAALKKHGMRLAPVLVSSGFITILTAIAFQGFLKDGITTWMPSYVVEVFQVETSVSILLNVALPIFSILSVYIATAIYKKAIRNEVNGSAIFFGISALLSLALFAFSDKSAVAALVLSALVVGCMHAINLYLISYVPSRFAAVGKTSTVSGLTNAFTYLGSSLSSYLTALLAEQIGWQYTVLCWCIVAVGGLILCLFSIRRWKRFIGR